MTKQAPEYVVLCAEHYNPLGLVRSLGEEGLYPIVFVVKGERRLVSKSKYIKRLFFVDSLLDGLNEILRLYGKDQKDFLFVCDDLSVSMLDERYDDIKDRFYTFNAGRSNRINEYLEKQKIQDLAKECGFKTPRTHIINRHDEIPMDLEYPIITKAISSITGGWKEDVFVCQNKQELLDSIPKIKSENIALQNYLLKENELCLDGFSFDHGKNVFLAIASSYDYLIEDSYSPLMTVTNVGAVKNHDFIENNLKKMFARIGFEGIFSAEFLIVKGEPVFLEINFRNSTWSYASTKCGMNLPVLWSKAMMGEGAPEKPAEIRAGFRAMVEPDDFKYRVVGKRISLLKWLREKRRCGCLFYYDKRDKGPTRGFWAKKVFNKLGKVFHRRHQGA